MFITVMADASYCSRSRSAGYGFWIACERGKKAGSGFYTFDVVSACEAEMLAVADAIYNGIKSFLIHKGDSILVQLDSIPAISAFTGERIPKQEKENQAIEYLWLIKNQFNLEISFKHVKGHSNLEDARSKSNAHCDSAAKAALKQARQKKGRENGKFKTNAGSGSRTGKIGVSSNSKSKTRRYPSGYKRWKGFKPKPKTNS